MPESCPWMLIPRVFPDVPPILRLLALSLQIPSGNLAKQQCCISSSDLQSLMTVMQGDQSLTGRTSAAGKPTSIGRWTRSWST